MKRKLLALLLSIGMLAGCLNGCGTGNTADTTEKGAAATQLTAETESAEENHAVDYAYEQDLNIIEDNYRNYYEIFVGSFYDSDGDGIGDLNGVTDKLNYISDMGFNGIWLMPIMPSPTYHKYDVMDYMAVDSKYGTMDDFKQLAEECHKRGIRLIIDFVINHTSSQHPWFQEACSYLRSLGDGEEIDYDACPYVDYYHFSKDQGSGYYPISGTDYYYEGSFWSEMPDLNLADENLKKEIEKAADFWMDAGVDGFRMDAALHFEEGDTEFNTGVLGDLYRYCTAKNPDFYMVSEVWSGETTIANYYGSKTPSMFNFDAASAEGAIVKAAQKGNVLPLIESMIRYQNDFAEVNPEYIDAPFLTNHDMVRVANNLLSDEDRLKYAAGLLMMMNGSPFVYYGEEIGMKSSGQEDENKRLPMFWSAGDTTGITNAPQNSVGTVLSSLPSVEEQQKDSNSLLNYYRRALRLRNENPEIARGVIEKIDALCKDKQAAIIKTYGDSSIGILYNGGDEETTISLEGTKLETMNIRGYLTLNQEEVTLADQKVTMPAKSFCILK